MTDQGAAAGDAGIYRPRFQVWKAFMRRTGSLAGAYHSPDCRQDARVHTVQPGLEILTFWLDERIGGGGTGPCLSLYCHGLEVLRFDCFGEGLGHFHLTAFMPWVKRGKRFWFAEKTAEAQIERAVFELIRNLQAYLCLNPRGKVRRMRVDEAAVAAACREAREALMAHLERVDVLHSLKRDASRP